MKKIVRRSASSARRGARALVSAAQAWEPTKNVEFIIPAGTGGGADQMARAVQGIVAKHSLMKQSMVPINKAGGAGAEGFLDVKGAKGDPHKIIITLSNLFTTPLATGVPFNWRDLTPVQMLALDQFVLWVNAEKPYKTPKEYHRRGQEGRRPASMQDGRHRREAGRPDHHRRRSSSAPAPSSPTSRTRAAARWRCSWSASTSTRRSTTRSRRWRSGAAGQAAAAVRVRRQAHAVQGEGDRQDVLGRHPDLQGRRACDVDYLMLRGIFMAGGVTPEQVAVLRRPASRR